MSFEGPFLSALPATWTASTSYNSLTYLDVLGVVVPSPANGLVYIALSGGTSGPTQPVWPTTIGATVVDGGVTWQCAGLALLWELNIWDLIQGQSVNGDLGGTWAPATPIEVNSSNGGVLVVTGPTQIANGGSLQTLSGALVKLAAGDFPRNSPGHSGLSRRLLTDCALGSSDQLMSMRQDFSLSALRATACVLQLYVVPAGSDASVSVVTAPVQWQLPLEVHAGATIAQAVLSYLPMIGTPTARVVAVSPSGVLTPLTSQAAGANASGYVTAPAANGSGAQLWTIPVDGGATPSNAIVNRGACTYLLQVVEDQTQTSYPGVLPVLSPVAVATTGATDLANVPYAIDGVTLSPAQRVLVKNQSDPRQNGIYVYPTLPFWTHGTLYATGAIAVPQPPNGYYYAATTGGTSDGGQPTWPTTVGATVADNTVTWTCFGQGTGTPFPFTGPRPTPQWLPATTYAVGALVQPSPPNGCLYKCTTAGTTGTTQPLWPLATSVTTADGTVVWTCEGSLTPSAYTQAIDIRSFGLMEGAAVIVQSGNTNVGTFWQYGGGSIPVAQLGVTPALPWGTVPTGFPSGTVDVSQDQVGAFSALGNAYIAAAVDHVNITTQQFQ